MAKYLDKWKDLFPDTVGGTTRPSEAVSDQEEFNTNGFPQFIAQDPVNYALQNAFLKQFLSNDAWLLVKQQQANQALDKHKGDAQAHPNGISGNAASATKLRTPRALNLSGAVTADAATFDGTADATINVKTLDATKLKGTAPVSTTGNAATASKLTSPRTISLTGKAAGSTSFDGSANATINVTSVNADTASKLSTARKISITGNATGAAAFDGSADANISVTVNESKHSAAADTLKSSSTTETSTVARPVWLSWEGDNTKQAVSSNLTYTCSTKTLKAANFKGHLAGNADSATNADTVDGVHAYSMFYNKGNWADDNWATIGTYQVNGQQLGDNWYGWGQVISSSTNDARFQLYASDNYGGDGRLHYRTGWDNRKNLWNTILDSENYNLFAPTKTGGGASGTWGISITGNADTVDGYHASDLFRHLGGNKTPVITDIFDRAGTIDMSTMSTADKATHKANINKAPNMTQNIWNNGSGIHAYSGDADMAGYNRGTLKLTQSYKNFDKILVVGVNDRGDLLIYKLWDVWALANAFASGSHFPLFRSGDYWILYGSTRKGTNTNYVLSTDTVWSCQDQNSGIVAIYGIKY